MSKNAWMAGLVVAVVGVFGLAASSMNTAGVMNDKCPLSGKAVAADKSSDVTVKFCCGNCQAKFEKDPTACIGKVDKLPNEKCPVSGKAVGDASAKVSVGFCCGDCKGKFDADPVKYLGKIKAAEKK
jgi:YHS domain-containing protein